MQLSFQQRIELVLPPWWGLEHSNLHTLTAGAGGCYQQSSDQIDALRPLIRINTTTGEILDLVAFDFFGQSIARQINENDTEFRTRIKQNLFVIKGTRAAFYIGIYQLTGYYPIIIDPRQPNDTGAMGNVAETIVPTVFYNSGGSDCYTNINMPYQWFTQIKLPLNVTQAQLYQLILSLLPAGVVSWTHTE